MQIMRVIYDNAADRATVSATSQIGDLRVANLLTDIKGDTWRSQGTTATIDAVFPTGEPIGAVVLAFANFTSSATMRVRGYDNTDSLIVDTGHRLASGYAPMAGWGWGTMPLGANAYAYGGHVYGISWFRPASLKWIRIDIADTQNPAGYVEVGRLITGMYWEPAYGASYGAELAFEDNSTHVENDAGDTLTRISYRRRRLSFSLDWLTPADRNRVADIFRQGVARPAFLSLIPESGDPSQEQQYAIYGKRPSGDFSLAHEMRDTWRAQMTIREI